MNAIIIHTFKETAVRTVEQDGQVWFVASDIAKALNYRNADDMTRVLDDDERGTHIVRTPSGDQDMIVINESGLYHALIKSRKPEARQFRKWVTAEVLPTIRKTGKYESPAYSVNPGDVLSKEEADMLRDTLRAGIETLPKDKQGVAMVQGWSKLKAHFGVSYRQIPQAEFTEAMSIIGRHIAEYATPALPDARADSLRALLGASRWILSNSGGTPSLQLIEPDAIVASDIDIIRHIAEPGGFAGHLLPDLITAAALRLQNVKGMLQ